MAEPGYYIDKMTEDDFLETYQRIEISESGNVNIIY